MLTLSYVKTIIIVIITITKDFTLMIIYSDKSMEVMAVTLHLKNANCLLNYSYLFINYN